MKHLFASMVLLTVLSHATSGSAQSPLHDSVPYQGDTLLVNPLPMSVHDADQAYLDCDWVTLMSMIRDLEERIATALEVDTVYDVYVSGQVVGTSIFMNYDCVVLRDSIISLQIELDEALLGPPAVLSQEVLSIAQNVATIKAKITDDGGAPVRLWGVLFGKQAWWNDTLGFFNSDSLDIANLTDYTDILDSTMATRWEAMDNFWSGLPLPGTLPDVAVMDTASLNVDSVFVTAIKGLERYTDYIAVPIAANDSLFAEMMQPPNFEASELNVGPFGWYGMGDTLMFRTLPDLPSGFTLDTSSVTSNAALLKLSITDAGGQGPDEVTFYYDTLDFEFNVAAMDSLTSDSTGGTEHTVSLTGLTRYTDYYFNAIAENLAGVAGPDANMTFKTLPELATFDTVYFDASTDSLVATLSDDGGQAPTSKWFSIDVEATMSAAADTTATLIGGNLRALYAGEVGRTYYGYASATNLAGTASTDTVTWSTLAEVTTADSVTGNSATSGTLHAAALFGNAIPSTVGFSWGLQADLSDATDTTATLGADSTLQITLTGLQPETTHYFAGYATNAGGRANGDTLSFTTKVGLTDANIHEAVNAWYADSTDAEDTYGHISDWDVSLVTNISWLFANKSNFNSDITGWDVSAVTSMNYSFMNVGDFNQPIGDWDVGAVTSMENMFYNAADFNQPLENWDVGGVTNFSNMFAFASTFNQDLATWDVGWAFNMTSMFQNATNFNGDIGNWDTKFVTDMKSMFYACDSLNQSLNGWDVSSVTDMSGMFASAISFDQDLNNWDVSSVKNMSSMFNNAQNFNGDISNWNIENVTSMNAMFNECASFNQPLNSWDVSTVKDMEEMFTNATTFNQPLNDWDVSAVTSMSYMFSGAEVFNQALDNWDVSNVEAMSEMFYYAEAFNQDLNSWNVGAVKDMDDMFNGCTVFNGAISAWDVSNVTSMAYMFKGCDAFDGNISSWNVAAVSDMSSMFRECDAFNQDLGTWTVSQVTDMSRMFDTGQSFNQDLSSWDVSAVENMSKMFYYAIAFNQDLSAWDVSSVTNMTSFGAQASFSTAHYDAMLAAWSNLSLQQNVTFEINADYCYGDGARQAIIDGYNWNISDGNQCNPAPEALTGLATNVDETSADIGGSFSNMSTVSETGFKVSTDSTLAGATNQLAGTTSPFTLSLSGLTANTVYYYRAYATDELGTVQGSTESFQSHGAPLVGTIADTAWTDTTATLTGVLEMAVLPAVTATGFVWGALADLSDATDVAGSALTDTFTYALTASGPLYYAAYATNAIGTTYGDTIQLVGVPTLGTSEASQVTDTGAKLNATLSTARKALTATGFNWGYQQDLSDAIAVAGNVLTGDFSAELSGVDEGAKIYFSAFYTDATGTTHGDTLNQCLKSCEPVEYNGYTYETVLIDCQCWFAENLRSTQYRDGSTIPGGLSDSEWENTQSGAQAVYEETGSDSAFYASNYGRLYNHGAVVDSRGLCPHGWEVPASADFDSLITFLGGSTVAGASLKALDTETPGWDGTNTSGWSALPGGSRGYDGPFDNFDYIGKWWTTSFDLYNLPVSLSMFNNLDVTNQIGEDWRSGISVRCIRGDVSAPVASTVEARVTGSTTATLNGSVTFNGWKEVTATGFEWGLQSDLSDGTIIAGDTLAGDFSADLTGLVLGDTVYFSAYATNALGTAYGDTLSLVTTDCLSVEFDGYTYNVVEIGDQCWFAENLRSDNYADGTPIPGGLSDAEWGGTTEGAQAIYNGDSATYFADYGRLYNWYAVENVAGLCPSGWHVPTDEEFTALTDFLAGAAGAKLKSSASDSPSWDGTNSSGWSGLPGGYRTTQGSFSGVGNTGNWWSSSPSSSNAFYRNMFSSLSGVYGSDFNLRGGFSVRCLAAPAGAPVLSTDAASPVTETTATLNGSVASWPQATATGFKWGYEADLSDGTEVAGDTLSGAFSADLTGLVTNDSVYFVPYATNVFGTTYGDTLAFEVKTPACQNLTSYTYDGYDYDLVEIGDQCWFAENLRTTVYSEGSTIPWVGDAGPYLSIWQNTSEGARTLYDWDGSSLEPYGRMYNWHAVNDDRGLCPAGWHVPDTTEFNTLATALGGMAVAGEKMKAQSWDGTNESGWSGVPGGYRNADGSYTDAGFHGVWWTATETPSPGESYWIWLETGDDAVTRSQVTRQNGFSVRCLIDEPSAPVASTLEASNITDITATLNGSVDFNGWKDVTATGFKWGYAADLSDGVEVAGDTLAGEFTADLTGLVTDNTLYYVSYATNALGTTYGDTLSVLVKFYPCQGLTSVPYDGYDYDLVEIGAQCWFAENLRNDNYADGTPITGGLDDAAWGSATEGAQAIYNGNLSTYYADYGRLYNWFAVDSAAGLCPTGWHVPTDSEFVTLEVELGMVQAVAETNTGFRGTDQGTKMKSSASDSPSWEGTNESGWSGLPGGQRTWQGTFGAEGVAGVYWTSTPDPLLSTKAWKRLLLGGEAGVFRQADTKASGFSVRCLRDSD